MARIRIKSTEVQRNWRAIQDHLIRGDEVVVEHYNRPVALITPYQEDTVTTAQRFASDHDAKGEIINALGEYAKDHDIDAIFREAYAYRVDRDSDGNELLSTAGFEQIVNDEEFWEIAARHAVA